MQEERQTDEEESRRFERREHADRRRFARVDRADLEVHPGLELHARLRAGRKLELVCAAHHRRRTRATTRDQIGEADSPLARELDVARRARKHHERRRDAVREDDRRTRGAERVAVDHVVVGDVRPLLFADVIVTRRGQVRNLKYICIPRDDDFDRGDVRHFDFVRVHVRAALQHRVREGLAWIEVRPARRVDPGVLRLRLRGEGARRSERIRHADRRGGTRRKRERVAAGIRGRRRDFRSSDGGRSEGRCDRRTGGAGAKRVRGADWRTDARSRGGRRGNGSRSGRQNRGRRLRSRDLRRFELQQRRADLDLVARADLALVDALAVDHRAGLVAQVDQRDVAGARDLDDRMHARRELVVDTQMAARILADLDDVLRDRLATNEHVALVQRKCEGDLRLTRSIHRFNTFRRFAASVCAAYCRS